MIKKSKCNDAIKEEHRKKGKRAYAVLSVEFTVLTFYYDTHMDERGGLSVGPFGYDDIRWDGHAAEIQIVIFDDSFSQCVLLESTAHWFDGCCRLKEIHGIENLKTSAVKDMSHMFQSCSSLEAIDVSNFITRNVTNMEGMFKSCSSLKTLDVSMFDTRKVEKFSCMFESCTSLAKLDLCGFSAEVNALLCTTLYDEGFHTDNAFDMLAMFRNCKNLLSLNLCDFNTSEVVYMSDMFEGCSSIETIDLSSFTTNDDQDMDGMFSGCTNLKTIYVNTSWKTPIPKVCESGMFEGCINLKGGNGTAYNHSENDYLFARIDQVDNPGYFTEKDILSEE
jgi:surface protein